ncbi:MULTISPECIES: hypothetical protein [unclassified Streptomyces]|uniref:hypothetical protein n=1 Tax=unclassified Streptomyces TaxID=2593676 RepID=UPI0013018130|nr:hypothetical protein [Streptomyces sp. CB01883]
MMATLAAAVGRIPEITGETAEITPTAALSPLGQPAAARAASDWARVGVVEMSAVAT